MSARLITDGAVLAAVLRGPEGPVTRYLIERATVFQAAARRQAPVRSGCLRGSIVKRFETTPEGTAIRIVSDTRPCSPTRTAYSLFVHEGTAPHQIVAKNGGVLAFFWANGPDGPGTYYFRSVQHPGTKANRFLADNLYLFGVGGARAAA